MNASESKSKAWWCAATALACVLLVPQRGLAQQHQPWEVTVAPLYFWAPQVSGNVTAMGSSVPVHVDFADVAKNLAGAFSVHIEARKGRWGGFGDLIEGTLQLDSVIFEGGVRTFALSPKMEFTGAMVQVAPVDTSQTSTDGFVGLTLRPALTPTLRVIGRADIGGGTADLTQYGPIFGLDLHWGGK